MHCSLHPEGKWEYFGFATVHLTCGCTWASQGNEGLVPVDIMPIHDRKGSVINWYTKRVPDSRLRSNI